MNFKVQKSECSVSEPLFVYSFQGRSKVFVLGEGGGGVPDSKKFSEPRSGEEKILGLLGGPGACSHRKFLKYRVQDWLKMHFLRFHLGKTR